MLHCCQKSSLSTYIQKPHQRLSVSCQCYRKGRNLHGGSEATVHSMHHIQENLNIQLPDDKWSFLLDFLNAFTSIDYRKMFEEVRIGFLLCHMV